MKDLQKKRIAGDIGDTLIFVQHPEVVTIGPKAVRDNVIVEGYPTLPTDRGGGITWHGPGQLVVYPIVKWDIEDILAEKNGWENAGTLQHALFIIQTYLV